MIEHELNKKPGCKQALIIARSYINSIRDHVNRCMIHNWKQGQWQGLAPVGYKNTRDANNKADIVIDSVQGPIVKKLFEEFATGKYTISSLTRLARRAKLRGNAHNSKKTIQRTAISDMLRNPFYYGEMRVRGQIMPHKYDPIIDKKLFDKVQTYLR